MNRKVESGTSMNGGEWFARGKCCSLTMRH